MATFPALEPAGRSYRMGRYPVLTQPLFAAEPARFLQSAVSVGYVLRLTYTYLSAAEAKLIRDHWREQSGGIEPFLLSNEVMLNHGGSNIVSATKRWRYISPPQEQQLTGGLVNITLELETVEGTFALGAAMAVAVVIAVGKASAGGPAMAIGIIVSFAPGSAEGPDHKAPGADLVVTITITAGAFLTPAAELTITTAMVAGKSGGAGAIVQAHPLNQSLSVLIAGGAATTTGSTAAQNLSITMTHQMGAAGGAGQAAGASSTITIVISAGAASAV